MCFLPTSRYWHHVTFSDNREEIAEGKLHRQTLSAGLNENENACTPESHTLACKGDLLTSLDGTIARFAFLNNPN
jgi:hypothetical protein